MNNSDIIKALAKGVNPITGELISNDDLLSDPTIIRALYSAVESMKSGNIDHSSSNNLTSTSTTREDNNIKKGLPKNHRKPWDSNSIDELVYKFKNGSTASELAEYFERTLFSINGVLLKEGLIDQDDLPAPPSPEKKREINIKLGRPLNHGIPWDPQSLDELINKYKNGSTIAELSKYYDRSVGSIRSTLSKNIVLSESQDIKNRYSNLPRNHGKPWSGSLKEELFDKFRSGSSIPELAKYFERTEGSIGSTLFDKGLINTEQYEDSYSYVGQKKSTSIQNNKDTVNVTSKTSNQENKIKADISESNDQYDPDFPFKI